MVLNLVEHSKRERLEIIYLHLKRVFCWLILEVKKPDRALNLVLQAYVIRNISHKLFLPEKSLTHAL